MYEPITVREYLSMNEVQKAAIQVSTGGQLSTEDAEAFILSTIAQDAFMSRVSMQEQTAGTSNIQTLKVAARVIRLDVEVTVFTSTTAPTISSRTLTTKEVILAYDIGDQFLRRNIQGADVNEVLQTEFTTAFSNDLHDMGVNGDENSGDAFLQVNDGWIDIADADASTHETSAAAMSDDFLGQIFPAMLAALPNKYRANRSKLAFIVSTDMEQTYREQLGSRETAGGDAALQQFDRVKFSGIEVEPNPYFPDTFAMLTPLDNLFVGFTLNVSVESMRQPRKRLTEWTITAEYDYNYADSDAVSLATSV